MLFYQTRSTKDHNVGKKLMSSTASAKRMSYTSTTQASKVGTVARRSVVISDGKNVEKGSLAGGKYFVQVMRQNPKRDKGY